MFFSAFHTAIVYSGQVNCSLSDPAVFDLCRQQLRRCLPVLEPDIVFMGHDEIRVAGWEPGQVGEAGKTGIGPLLAENVRVCQRIIAGLAPDKPAMIWSDMFDPHHNATAGDYYLVNGARTGSWEGLNPETMIMKWGGGERARPGLEHFAGRGHRQMIAAFYDSNVARNHAMWTAAAEGVPGIEGVMYTTWRGDYSKLEDFARVWW